MLTIERTEDYILLKIPSTTSEGQLLALQEAYERIKNKEFLLNQLENDVQRGIMDEDGFIIDPEISRLSRIARKGGWKNLKAQFNDNAEFQHIARTFSSEEE